VFSTVRRKRNQKLNGIGDQARRCAAQVHCDQAEATAMQKQIHGAQRLIHIAAAHPKQLLQETPTDCAQPGSNESCASTSAQTSAFAVRAVKAVCSREVIPDEIPPKTSVRQPRGKPPASWSTAAIPAEAVMGCGS